MGAVKTLVCEEHGGTFEVPLSRGRYPRVCGGCKASARARDQREREERSERRRQEREEQRRKRQTEAERQKVIRAELAEQRKEERARERAEEEQRQRGQRNLERYRRKRERAVRRQKLREHKARIEAAFSNLGCALIIDESLDVIERAGAVPAEQATKAGFKASIVRAAHAKGSEELQDRILEAAAVALAYAARIPVPGRREPDVPDFEDAAEDETIAAGRRRRRAPAKKEQPEAVEEPPVYPCRTCGQPFKTSPNRDTHERFKHPGPAPDVAALQDPSHTEADFMRDLRKATERIAA